jgi:hypothetical protein
MSEPLSNIRMVVYDWYDGPAGGILIEPRCGKAYRFHLLDWDSAHRIRLFALQEVSPTVVDSLFELTSEDPKWPVWYPKLLIQPTDEAREWAGSVDGYRIRPDRVDSILVWDSGRDLALGLRELDGENRAGTVSWFDAVESPGGAPDWFEILSLPRG